MPKLTISVSDEVYEGLRRKCGPRGIGRFIEQVVRPHVANDTLDAAYAEMGADEAREREALEWGEAALEDCEPR